MNIFFHRLARQLFVALILSVLPGLATAEGPGLKTDEAIYQPPSRHTELLILQEKLKDDMDLLESNRKTLENLKEINKKQEGAPPRYVETKQVEEAKYSYDQASISLDKIKIALASAQKNITLLQNYITEYEEALINARARNESARAEKIEQRLVLEREKLSIEKERVKILSQLLPVATDIQKLTQNTLTQRTERLRLEQVATILKGQKAEENELLGLQKGWEEKLNQSRSDLEKLRPLESPPTPDQQVLLDEIAQAQDYMQLYQIKLKLLGIEKLLEAYDKRDLSDATVSYFSEAGKRLEKIKEELKGAQIFIQNQQVLLQRQMDALKQPGADYALSSRARSRMTKMYSNLKIEYERTEKSINELGTGLTSLQNILMEGARQTWQTRQQLPHDLADWAQFAKDMWTLPQLAYQSVVSAYQQLVSNLSNASGLIWFLLFALMAGWIALCVWIRRLLAGFLANARDKGLSFSANAFIIFAQLFYRNIAGVTLFGALLIITSLLRVSSNNMVALISLGCVWFFYRIATGLARISLFENIWDLSGSDVILYKGLRWSLGLGSFIIALTVLAHYLPLPSQITSSFDRLFMLVLLGVSIPLLRGWRVLPSIFAKEGKSKPYVRRMALWLGFLIPFTLFSNAIIGLVGYVNLAWIIWIAEGQFLLVLTALVLARGLLGDTMEFLAKVAIRNLKSGWVWTESILKPIHTVLHLLFLFIAGWALFRIYGLDQNVTVMSWIAAITTQPIFEMSGVSITAYNLIQFAILLMVIRWAAKWSREFAYRFIFAKYKDKGLRNSMAVFTQYTTIMVGGFVILKVVGIDLTTLTVVLGALAVGIGFGLQGIANNIVSGILLLVERPFRAGDIITLGTNEGEVTHIGVRATTIKTWDNMEVIIPNAETVTQALTNWTHHDTIVRTTFDLHIGFKENPHQAEAIILQVLRRHPSVVSLPEPSVMLTSFAEYALRFQVRYFIDLSLGQTRAVVRSKILFAIWDSMRAAGIEIPYPHQSIEISSQNKLIR